MAKIVFNPMIDEIHGGVNQLIVRKHKGIYVMAKKSRTAHEPTPAQVAHQERFLLAVEYGRMALSEPLTRTFYAKEAIERETSPMAACIADFFHAPTILSVESKGYVGMPGGSIVIKTRDDFGVVKVDVELSDDVAGTQVEKGEAVESAPGSGLWTYTARNSAPAVMTFKIQATATDRPGGIAVRIEKKNLG